MNPVSFTLGLIRDWIPESLGRQYGVGMGAGRRWVHLSVVLLSGMAVWRIAPGGQAWMRDCDALVISAGQ
jgi:hypothetical protein